MDLEDDINKDMNEPEYKSGYEEAEKELAINLNQHYADNPNLPIVPSNCSDVIRMDSRT